MADVSDASRSTATRRTRGATSLSSSSHFALIPYSNGVNPVTLPPGRARLSTRPAPTGSVTCTNTIGVLRAGCCNASAADSRNGENDIGRERDQFSCIFSCLLGITRMAPSIVDPHGAADNPSCFLQPLMKRRHASLYLWIVGGHA